MQDVLFSVIGEEDSPSGTGPLCLASLNLQGASPSRTFPLLKWCSRVGADAFAFTEVLASNVGTLVSELRALGYECFVPASMESSARCAVVAASSRVKPELRAVARDGRWVQIAFRPAEIQAEWYLTSVYAPTNAMTMESSIRRKAWQEEFVRAITGFPAPGVLLGDFNVLEPGHVPRNDLYSDHDYEFYSSIVAQGYSDLYRATNPKGLDTSWYSARCGAQRLDHAFGKGLTIGLKATYDHSTRGSITDHSSIIVQGY